MVFLHGERRRRSEALPPGSLLLPGVWFVVALMFGASAWAQSEQIAVGFPAFARDINYLESSHPVALVLRAAVSEGLTRRNSSTDLAAYRLALSDSMSVSADYSRWSFRLRPAARFHNGRPVRASDVRYSLLRCKERKLLALEPHEVEVRLVPPDSELYREWVDIRLAPGVHAAAALQAFPASLSQCPVLEQESATLFQQKLGQGTNIVASGDYAVSSFKANGEFVLSRFSAQEVSGKSAALLVLRAFDDATRAFTALRSGTIDALFLDGQELIEKARTDQTLSLTHCLVYSVLMRKGFVLPCEGDFDLSGMRYKS